MSNIEPTEEQRAAAVKHHYKYAVLPDKGYLTDWVRTGDATGRSAFDEVVRLARLLAEREAKLHKQLAFMEAGSLADYNAFAEALQKEDAYLAEINLINERLAEMREVDGRKSRMLYDRDVVIDTLRARVAELEATCGERLARLGEAYEEAETGWLGDIKELEAREAQHLADIKVLRAPSRLPFAYGVQAAAYDKAIAATAHYDDAKADAPAVCRPDDNACGYCSMCKASTEGGEG